MIDPHQEVFNFKLVVVQQGRVALAMYSRDESS